MSSWLMTVVMMKWLLVSSLMFMFLGYSISSFIFLSKTLMDMITIMDSKSSWFFSSIIVISLCVFYWAWYYMQESKMLAVFYMLLFLFVCSMLFLVFSYSLFMMFLGWEGLGLTSFLLIIFYQNWSSGGGGLLTLMTNRLGDAVLMLSFAYWMISSSALVTGLMSSSLLLFLFLLTMTKSAQVPFSSWLPAAMAAPTPVSALVHSSTLVTAGVWVLIRFGQASIPSLMMFLFFGVFTLLVASSAALVESDAKKVVALSTLSQLGLMYMSLYLGGLFVTFFHLLMHAMAKASLFLMVGNLLHSRFTQQDFRFLSSGSESKTLYLMMFISVLSLSGVVFTSGFFSKDFILLGHYSMMSSALALLLIMGIVSLTAAYCYKLYFNILCTSVVFLKAAAFSALSTLPCLVLSLLSLVLGYVFLKNFFLVKLISFSSSGLYWMMLVLFVCFTLVSHPFLGSIFKSQSEVIGYFNKKIMVFCKTMSLKLSSTFLESGYMATSLFLVKILAYSSFMVIIISLSIMAILVF